MGGMVEVIGSIGVWFWPMALLALAAPLPPLIALSFPVRSAGLGLQLAPWILMLIVGEASTVGGFRMVAEAVSYAAPEVRALLAIAGTAEVMNGPWLASLLAAGLAALVFLVTGIRSLIHADPTERLVLRARATLALSLALLVAGRADQLQDQIERISAFARVDPQIRSAILNAPTSPVAPVLFGLALLFACATLALGLRPLLARSPREHAASFIPFLLGGSLWVVLWSIAQARRAELDALAGG
jgi:hypothetical protein